MDWSCSKLVILLLLDTFPSWDKNTSLQQNMFIYTCDVLDFFPFDSILYILVQITIMLVQGIL
jgi:hypothetical protein